MRRHYADPILADHDAFGITGRSTRCQMTEPFGFDRFQREKVATTVRVPSSKSGIEAINEWRMFPVAHRDTHDAPLQLTNLARELPFLVNWLETALLGNAAVAARLLVSEIDAASRPHVGHPDHWRLLIPFAEYLDFLYLFERKVTSLAAGDALLLEPGTISSSGHFGAEQGIHLVLDFPREWSPNGLLPVTELSLCGRRPFGHSQTQALQRISYLASPTNFDRIFDLLCMLPFDFDLDLESPFDFASEIAGTTQIPELCERAHFLREVLVGCRMSKLVIA